MSREVLIPDLSVTQLKLAQRFFGLNLTCTKDFWSELCRGEGLFIGPSVTHSRSRNTCTTDLDTYYFFAVFSVTVESDAICV